MMFEYDPATAGILGLIVLILDIIALVSILGGTGSTAHKVIWTLVVIFFPCIGMALYFLVGRSPRDA